MPEVFSIQDFNLIRSNIQKSINNYGSLFSFKEESIGFIIFFLEKFFGLQEDDIETSITDSIFVSRQKNYKGSEDFSHDRGINAIIINENEKTVDIFNFKYKSNFKDVGKHFESLEIDKVIGFLRNLFERNDDSFKNINPTLKQKIEEIELLQDKKYINFQFKIHFVSNTYNGFTEDEEKRLNTEIKKLKYATFDYFLLPDLANKLSDTEKKINGRFRAIDEKFFEKSGYGYKAFITEIKGEDIIRLTLNDEKVRDDCDLSVKDLVVIDINEDAFEDNVRLYLKQDTNINAGIKKTALDSEESLRFFFFNNGITITCNKITQSHHTSSPIIGLEGLQIVNGGQTIHSLKEALNEDYENFKNISVLCRIYETQDKLFKNKIAEYTNSQNAVTNRDIRSVDVCQIKLEEELKLKGYYYERKKNQHEDQEKSKRIDSEKIGQIILAFYLEMPMEAKNRKNIIFSEKYTEIFNSDLTANKVLLVYNLYNFIESKKRELKNEKEYIEHASYYILYFMKILTGNNKNYEDYIKNYENSLEKIEFIISKEKEKLEEKYIPAYLFKSNRPKSYLSELNL